MRQFRPWRIIERWLAGAAMMASLIGAHSNVVYGQQNDEIFERWTKTHAIPIQTVETVNSATDLQPLKSIIGAARVVALGEPAHGAHEPLALRNRLFRYLVEELGFTAIAIESGLPESRRIYDLVTGGPGDTSQAVRANLSCGGGESQENEELVRWIREYNTKVTAPHKVRFYAIDVGRCGQGTPLAIENALNYISRVDPTSGQKLRAAFKTYLDRLSASDEPSFSQAESDKLSASIEDLLALFERERPALIAATSEIDYQWAHRNAMAARQAHRQYRVRPTEPPGAGIPPSAWRSSSQRDAAMADNVRWVLEREGPGGRILVYAHNAHIKNSSTEGGIWNAFEQPPTVMGQHLRSALGADLLIIGISSAQNGVGLPTASLEPVSLDAALSHVGPPLFLLDLRAARSDSAANAWLAERRAMRANFTSYLTLSPGAAFDALLFIDTLTPARAAPPAR
ncbi:MAG: erythromycin esterase family protein [Chloracidobacterium sp.]|nr:erythromycin esterase family protein [Chloracidobacterium sp.]